MVHTWLVGFCSKNRCHFSLIPSTFTLHGWWPVNEKGQTLKHYGSQNVKCFASHNFFNFFFLKIEIKNILTWLVFFFLITWLVTFNVKSKFLLSKRRIFFCLSLDIKYLINVRVTHSFNKKTIASTTRCCSIGQILKRKQRTTTNLYFVIMNTTDMEAIPISSLKSISEKPWIWKKKSICFLCWEIIRLNRWILLKVYNWRNFSEEIWYNWFWSKMLLERR